MPFKAPLRRHAIGSSHEDVTLIKWYLRAFGHLVDDPSDERRATFDVGTMRGLLRFQAFAAVPQTGVYDASTAHALALPRCGTPDFDGRALSGARWDHFHITYSVVAAPTQLTLAEVQNAVAQACGIWSGSSNLTFEEVPRSTPHDIELDFGASSDGPGKQLAFSLYPPPYSTPPVGIHFDAAESWSVSGTSGTDLITVAAHELGHALGLNHSQLQGSLMWPFITGPHRFLAQDDIDSIQLQYALGPRIIVYEDIDFLGRAFPITTDTFRITPFWNPGAGPYQPIFAAPVVSSIEYRYPDWGVLFEGPGENWDNDQLWIRAPRGHYWSIANLHTMWRPHGDNRWGDKINSVQFFPDGPGHDLDNAVVLDFDGKWRGNIPDWAQNTLKDAAAMKPL